MTTIATAPAAALHAALTGDALGRTPMLKVALADADAALCSLAALSADDAVIAHLETIRTTARMLLA